MHGMQDGLKAVIWKAVMDKCLGWGGEEEEMERENNSCITKMKEMMVK